MDATTHHRLIGSLWAGVQSAAADNPVAWSPEPLTAEEIVTPSARNPMLAFPYTKRLTSQWNVDQAAGLISARLAVARGLGIPESRWVFPWAVAESNHMLPLVERRCARSPGFAVVGGADRGAHGIAPRRRTARVYSCFPAAVRLQCRELGIGRTDADGHGRNDVRAGGPSTISSCKRWCARRTSAYSPGRPARDRRQRRGHQARRVVVGDSPPGRRFSYDDVAAEVAAATEAVQVVGDRTGAGRVAAYTVLHERGMPRRGVALVDFADGTRTLATTDDAAHVAALLDEEWCGRAVTVTAGGALSVG